MNVNDPHHDRASQIGIDAAYYATLGLGLDTSHGIAYRDLGFLVEKHCPRKDCAVDVGCGAGRSSRLLKHIGFTRVTGVDIRDEMLDKTKQKPVLGVEYLLMPNGFVPLEDGTCDLAFSGIVLLEISRKEDIEKMLGECRRVIQPDGTVMILTHTKEGYTTDSESFECLLSHEDKAKLKDGDLVSTRAKATKEVFTDIFWSDAFLKRAFDNAGFRFVQEHIPIPTDEQIAQSTELTKTPRWVIYVLKKKDNVELPVTEAGAEVAGVLKAA